MLVVLNRLDALLAQLEKALLVLFCFALTAIMISQVILRYFFSSPIFWAEEISVQFLIFISVFGISYITYKNQHISIDFLLVQMSGKTRKWVGFSLGVIFLFLMSFLCFYSWEWVLRPDVQIEKSGTTGLPRWYNYVAMPIAFSFLCWHQLVILINSVFYKNKEG